MYTVGIAQCVWNEDFTLSDGTTSDAGATAWSIDAAAITGGAADQFDVRSNQFEVNYTDNAGIWTSESIDISGYGSVNVSVDLSESGSLESTDTIRVVYILDGGQKHYLPTGARKMILHLQLLRQRGLTAVHS